VSPARAAEATANASVTIPVDFMILSDGQAHLTARRTNLAMQPRTTVLHIITTFSPRDSDVLVWPHCGGFKWPYLAIGLFMCRCGAGVQGDP
jgi:hypothetical protein